MYKTIKTPGGSIIIIPAHTSPILGHGPYAWVLLYYQLIPGPILGHGPQASVLNYIIPAHTSPILGHGRGIKNVLEKIKIKKIKIRQKKVKFYYYF